MSDASSNSNNLEGRLQRTFRELQRIVDAHYQVELLREVNRTFLPILRARTPEVTGRLRRRYHAKRTRRAVEVHNSAHHAGYFRPHGGMRFRGDLPYGSYPREMAGLLVREIGHDMKRRALKRAIDKAASILRRRNLS